MSTSTTRRTLAGCAVIALLAAACGGDDDDTTATAPPGDDDTTATAPPGDDDTTATAPSGDDDTAVTDPPTDTANATTGTEPYQPPDYGETSATEPPPGEQPILEGASISFEPQESDGTSITVAEVVMPWPGFIAVHGDGGGSPGPVIGHSELLGEATHTDVVVELDEPLTEDATLYPMVHIDVDGDGTYDFFPPDETTDAPGQTLDGEVAVTGAEVSVTADGAEATDAAEITIAGFAFDGVTEVGVGTTVTVTNTDSARHTWTAVDGTFDSGTMEPGATFEFTFTEPGEFEYFCAIHPSMEGTITVTG